MKFKKVKRPKVVRAPSERPRILRRKADICPWCGAVESMRAVRSKRDSGRILRYSVCKKCGKHVTRVVLV